MNKKFLSAILFGALMVSSTGTFVSCKDYDDDIDQINAELTDLKSKIAALESTIANGDYVTDVTKTADGKGMTFTFSKGKTITVAFDVKDGADGKPGAPGKDAQQVTVDAKTGELLIDGKGTGIFPAKDAVKAPVKIGEDGFWYALDEKGEYVDTKIPVSGLSVAGSEAEGWTLTIIDANGKAQEVKVPTASSLMSEFELMGTVKDGSLNESDLELKYAASPVEKKWEGPKGVVAKGDYIIATAENPKTLLVRMAPSSVDFTGQTFALVNSKGNSHDWLALNPVEAYDAVLTKAAQKSGLYTITLAPTVVKAAAYANANKWNVDNKAFDAQVLALQNEAGTFTSQFGLSVKYNGTAMVNASVELNGEAIPVGNSKDNPIEIDLDVDNAITFVTPNAVYDSYITYSDDDKVLFGISDDDKAMTFKATSMPDSDTKAVFAVKVHYLNVNGKVVEKVVYVKVTKSLVDGVVYERNHKIVADASKNFFSIDLKSMTDKMSEANLAVFNRNAKVANTTFTVKDANGTVVAGLQNVKAAKLIEKGLTPTFLNAKNEEINDKVADATTVKFAVNNANASQVFKVNTPYTIEVVYAGEVKLADATIKLTFSLPALADHFVHQDGIWVNNVASAYMSEKATIADETYATSAKYVIKNAFKKLSDNIAELTFNANLDNTTAVLGDYKSADLAELSKTAGLSKDDVDSWTITLKNDLNDDGQNDLNENGTQKGYKQNLTINISKATYCGWSYGDATHSFILKVMSPILEGAVYAVGNEVVIPSASLNGYKINDSHIKAHTYNKEVVYSIFNDSNSATGLSREEVRSVRFESGNDELFEVDAKSSAYVPATGEVGTDGYKPAKFGEIEVTKVSSTSIDQDVKTFVKVTVKDVWGYTLTQEVPVKITVKK